MYQAKSGHTRYQIYERQRDPYSEARLALLGEAETRARALDDQARLGQVLAEMARVLKPGGRLQIADILVEKAVSEESKGNIDLWTG